MTPVPRPIVAVLDDYTGATLNLVDWSTVRRTHDVRAFRGPIPTDDLVGLLADTEVVVAIRERTAIDETLLRRLPALRLLVATGQNHALVDLDAARRLGIRTACTTGSGHSAVPELTIGLMLALARNIAAEDAAMRAGGWQHTLGFRLSGQTLGVIGLGRLGAPVAELAAAFGMRVWAWSPHLTAERAAQHAATAVGFEQLLEQSDLVTVHLPLNEGTRSLIGARELALMKPSAYLINTSRGPIVDETALVDALCARRLAGAGLDVYEQEPLPAAHPLRALPNTVLLPHLGYATEEGLQHTFAQVVGLIEDYLGRTGG